MLPTETASLCSRRVQLSSPHSRDAPDGPLTKPHALQARQDFLSEHGELVEIIHEMQHHSIEVGRVDLSQTFRDFVRITDRAEVSPSQNTLGQRLLATAPHSADRFMIGMLNTIIGKLLG